MYTVALQYFVIKLRTHTFDTKLFVDAFSMIKPDSTHRKLKNWTKSNQCRNQLSQRSSNITLSSVTVTQYACMPDEYKKLITR